METIKESVIAKSLGEGGINRAQRIFLNFFLIFVYLSLAVPSLLLCAGFL